MLPQEPVGPFGYADWQTYAALAVFGLVFMFISREWRRVPIGKTPGSLFPNGFGFFVLGAEEKAARSDWDDSSPPIQSFSHEPVSKRTGDMTFRLLNINRTFFTSLLVDWQPKPVLLQRFAQEPCWGLPSWSSWESSAAPRRTQRSN